jgi:hypothetical protein
VDTVIAGRAGATVSGVAAPVWAIAGTDPIPAGPRAAASAAIRRGIRFMSAF